MPIVAANYKLYFDEERHIYYDDFNNPFTSVTTILGKYEHKFDTDEVARRCWKSGLKGNPKYRGKSVEQIKREWDKIKTDALAQGNEKHNYLEVAVKDSNKFYLFHKRHQGNNRRLYTVPEVITNPGHGELSIDVFIETGIKDRYPQVFFVIQTLVNLGYRIYSEIAVFNIELLVSGLIDILFIKDKDFIILDWKTNKAPIKFEAGYWEKDQFGELTNNFIQQDHKLLAPLSHLASSVGNKYSLQLSIYAWLAQTFGLTCKGVILCQIRQLLTKEEVSINPYPLMLTEAETLLRHHITTVDKNTQYKMKLF